MEEQRIHIELLNIVNNRSDLKKLRHFGLTYRQIAALIESNVLSGNLSSEGDLLSITELGKNVLESRQNELKETDKSKWIDLDYKSKVKQIDKDDVFLPRKDDLSFLK